MFAVVAGRSWLPDDGERRFGNLLAALSGTLRYNLAGEEGDEALFDIARDPWELEDLVSRPAYALDVARFRRVTDPIAESRMSKDPLAGR